MATILLSAAGAAVGSVLGPVGTMVGRALGATAGYMIDQALIRSTLPDSKGPRLSDVSIQTSTEGRAIPRLYGRARLTGQLIWATRYVEEATEHASSGGKSVSGPTTTDYSYFANFAVGLCEGPISHIGRVFANGEPLDTTAIQFRIHKGAEDQPADSLIIAKQTAGAPAYRGLAYVVFERLPLAAFGNRIPQLSFEVIRAVDTLEDKVRAVTLIPGATEYGYATREVQRQDGAGAWTTENRHMVHADSDFLASLDELQALCPNLKRVSLVVTWFGTDLRAGLCQLKPGVENAAKATNAAWVVNGINRSAAYQVSQIAGSPAFGGTPSDASVIAAIQEIRSRGLEVVLYPFILMDIPAGNALPDPYGGAAQAAFPWRGRITCHPAAGQPGTVDKTSAAASQIAAFVGSAAPAHFSVAGTTVSYSGPAEWSYRRFLLHYARLAQAAGGVDAFLMSTELRGLTTVRSATSTYPFVTAMVALASDLKSVLGAGCKLSYGADWSEFSGHHADDGSGDVHFHLDPLWASSAIDFVGIDNYLPLSDWRHGEHLDEDLADTPHDLGYLRGQLDSGEYYDWYYGSQAARSSQSRSAISDGAYGKPWVFRRKDLRGWWENRHYDRPGGIENASPTAWASQSKPIWFTETGCPAVDLGANQPNVFPDARSSEGGLPYFSRGARDDLMSRRFAEAILTAWNAEESDARPDINPTSAVYAAPMVPADGLFLWTWDARPFPAFPALTSVWSDGPNWATGHWLNGRLGGTSAAGLINAILADHGFSFGECVAVQGHLDGFVVDDRMSARAALEPILAAFQIDAFDAGTSLRFAGRKRRLAATLTADDLLDAEGKPLATVTRSEDQALPASVALTVSDALQDYRRVTVSSRRLAGASTRETSADLAVVLPVDVASGLAETWLQETWGARESFAFTLSPRHLALEPGDIIDLPVSGKLRRVLIERIEDGTGRRIEARSIDPDIHTPVRAEPRRVEVPAAATFGQPDVVVIDIARDTETSAHQPLIAATLTPWPGSLAILRSISGTGWSQIGTLRRRATMGRTTTALAPGPIGLWDNGAGVTVMLAAGTLASLSDDQTLAGGNLAAIAAPSGGWEVLQFAQATLIAPDTYLLTQLLRGQRGSEEALASAIPAGSRFVLLDDAVQPPDLALADLGLAVSLKVGPSRYAYTSGAFVDLSVVPTGRGLKPYAPVHAKARRDPASGDVALSWIRRSRAPGADSWVLSDAPLGETTESYRIEILNGGTVVRAATVASPAYTYPAALQTADFGSLPSALTCRIRQMSPVIGDGLPLTATLTP